MEEQEDLYSFFEREHALTLQGSQIDEIINTVLNQYTLCHYCKRHACKVEQMCCVNCVDEVNEKDKIITIFQKNIGEKIVNKITLKGVNKLEDIFSVVWSLNQIKEATVDYISRNYDEGEIENADTVPLKDFHI